MGSLATFERGRLFRTRYRRHGLEEARLAVAEMFASGRSSATA